MTSRDTSWLELMRVLARTKKELKGIGMSQFFFIPQEASMLQTGEEALCMAVDDLEEMGVAAEHEGHYLFVRYVFPERVMVVDLYPSLATFQAFIASGKVRSHEWYELVDFYTPHLRLQFVGKDAIVQEQRMALTEALKEKGKRVSGENAFPLVTFSDGFHAPTTQLSDAMIYSVRRDIDFLLEAIAQNRETIWEYSEKEKCIRFFRRKGGYQLDVQDLPEGSFGVGNPDLSKVDTGKLEAVQNLRREGTYFSFCFPMDVPVFFADEPERGFPFVFYTGEELDTGERPENKRLFLLIRHLEEEKERVVEELLDFFIKNDCAPEFLQIREVDAYTRPIMQALCSTLGIQLRSVVDRFYELTYKKYIRDAEEYIYDYTMRSQRKEDQGSFLIRASLCRSCFRDIQISKKSSFENLAIVIVQSYEFEEDHLFSFTIPLLWENRRILGISFAFDYDVDDFGDIDYYIYNGDHEDDYKAAQKNSLCSFGLEKGSMFQFLFDFGDRWKFSCKVLEVLEEETEGGSKVVAEVGEAPEQYPSCD